MTEVAACLAAYGSRLDTMADGGSPNIVENDGSLPIFTSPILAEVKADNLCVAVEELSQLRHSTGLSILCRVWRRGRRRIVHLPGLDVILKERADVEDKIHKWVANCRQLPVENRNDSRLSGVKNLERRAIDALVGASFLDGSDQGQHTRLSNLKSPCMIAYRSFGKFFLTKSMIRSYFSWARPKESPVFASLTAACWASIRLHVLQWRA